MKLWAPAAGEISSLQQSDSHSPSHKTRPGWTLRHSLVGSSTALLDERGHHGGVQVRAGRSGVCACGSSGVAVGVVCLVPAAGGCDVFYPLCAHSKQHKVAATFAGVGYRKCSVSAWPHVSPLSREAPNTHLHCSVFQRPCFQMVLRRCGVSCACTRLGAARQPALLRAVLCLPTRAVTRIERDKRDREG